MTERAFKICSCGTAWPTRVSFITDGDVEIIGYTPNFGELELGWFFFNHHTCRTTLSVHVEMFADMADGPRFAESLNATPACPGYCVHRGELGSCPRQCECAWVRDIIQKLRRDIPPGESVGR